MDFLNKCSCIHCKEIKSVKGIFVHVDRVHLGSTKYSSGYNGKYKQLSEIASLKKEEKVNTYNQSPKVCSTCSNLLTYEQRRQKFCSANCSAINSNKTRAVNGWTFSYETRKKMSEQLTGKPYNPSKIEELICKECGITFNAKIYHKSPRTWCSLSCRRKKYSNGATLRSYRDQCAFHFNLKQFPEEFEFSLIEQYGWYKPSNKGNNLTGVSRDHMVSVRWGFENNIDPTIISHPANCKLMIHNSNISKGTDNSISYQELLNRIREWNLKYP